MTEKFDELGGALLVQDRRCHLNGVMSLVERGRPLNGDFILSDGTELTSAAEAIVYLFENPSVEGHQGWSCGVGFIGLEFGGDGSLVVIWAGYDVTIKEAIDVLSTMARVVAAERGYVSLGGWLPASREEFAIGFEGETLHRFYANE